jgi:hypothetical protein
MSDTRTGVVHDRVFQGLIAILAILVVVLAGPYILTSVLEKVYSSTRVSELQYTVTLTTSSSLSDLTLFIPLPTDGRGMSPIIQELGAGNRNTIFEEFQVSIYGANNESYLKVSTDQVPSLPGIETTYTFDIRANAPALHTRLPLQYDFTLLPKEDLNAVPCGMDPQPDSGLCFQYRSLIFASYRTSSDTKVEIRVDLIAFNRWKIGQEYHNGYSDHLGILLQGPTEGWHTAEGRMVTSIGDNNPFWEEHPLSEIHTHLTGGIDTSMMRWHTLTPLP